MRYLTIIPDGMADYPSDFFKSGKTPMEAAEKPAMDALAKHALCGTVLNVPPTMVPESDTANLAILSYDPLVYSKGRSPLEAVSMGLTMSDDDTAIRCNIVTISDGEEAYEEKTMIDHSADEISTEEADVLIRAVDEALGDEIRRFHTGISYRHCLLWAGLDELYPFNRPHDILGQKIGSYLPFGEAGEKYLALMKKSYDVLNHHPVNEARRARGKRPANSIWLWSPGKRPALPDFSEKWGLRAAVISAVDLIKGIGICAGMTSIDVEGATGNVNTNYRGKAEAAIRAFRDGYEFVYVHVEAPDECGHRGEPENKVLSVERIDREILAPCLSYLEGTNEPFRILVLPDHPTPLATRTHAPDPVPFFLYDSEKDAAGIDCFTEANAVRCGYHIEKGSELLSLLFSRKPNGRN